MDPIRWLRTHWRPLAGVLLLGVGAPIGVAGGWASKHDRLWWLLGAAICAAGAGVLQFDFTRFQPDRAAVAGTASDRASSHIPRRLWNIPPPVRTFIGRDAQLAAIRHQLVAGDMVALLPTATLHGMGGIGKTQLARAYAHRYADQYRLGWWVIAETELSILAALSELAILLGLSSQLPSEQLADHLHQILAEQDEWLLVFDNAEQPEMVEPFLPKTGGGHVLLTSRNPAWHGVADPMPVDLLPLKAAGWLLQLRTGDPDQQTAEILAEELGRLPLALEQAAAYISAQRLSLGRYLELYRTRHADLLARGVPVAYPDTADTTFSLALDRLREHNLPAAQLVQLCALLAPDGLPIRLLLSEPEWLPEPLATAVRDPLQAEEIVGALYRASLITLDLGAAGRMHRLVQVITRHHLHPSEQDSRLDEAIQLLAALFPDMAWEPNHWPRCDLLLPHAQAVLEHANRQQRISPAAAVLLTRVGIYLRARGLHRRARTLDERALTMRQQLYVGDHPAIVESRHALGADLFHMGEMARARELDEQALLMNRRLRTGDHPELARSIHVLGSDMRELGDVRRAWELHEEALAMRRRLFVTDHPDLGDSLQLLGMDLRLMGDVERARALHEEALAMRGRLFVGDHPAVAGTLDELANDLHELGDAYRARELHEEALAMRRRLYGSEVDGHDVAGNLRNLGTDLRALGDAHRARELHEQALAMYQRLYEGDHPGIASSLAELAVDLRELDKIQRSQELHAKAVAMRTRLTEAATGT